MVPVPLQNASNLRDLGGVPVADGRQVRTGLIFRAPALVGLSPEDDQTIAAIGLRTVCDLRGTREAAASPVVIDGANRLALPIEPSVGAGLKDILRTGQVSGQMSAQDMLDLLRDAYRAYALQSFAQYRSVFAVLQEDEGVPLLLHCSAGKDRTGFGAALILSALGADWATIVDDYLATNAQWRRETASNFELPPDLKEALLCAHEILLDTAFEAVSDSYGSTEAYLEQAIGLTGEARARLVERFTQ